MKVCAITNVYNERFNLPIWLRHYGQQVGIENCIVVDDGTDDGSTNDIGDANYIRVPRTTFDDANRAELISGLATALLRKYDAVIYSDADELLVADPRRFTNLVEFCKSMTGPAATAVGLNLLHNLNHEGFLSNDTEILHQRSHVQFVSPMCKTLIVREAPNWGGGFHSSKFKPAFSDLFLFHLRYVDLGEALRRMNMTRSLVFADANAGTHQRLSQPDLIKLFLAPLALPISAEFLFSDLASRFCSGVKFSHTGRFYYDGDFRSPSLFVVPNEFKNLF
jgi:glycosyltransferase involved in cell wall biosynthesis